MRIKCISNTLTEEQQDAIGGTLSKPPRWFSRITVGKKYTVLGVNFVMNSSHMNGVAIKICSDTNMIDTVPLCLFEIIDDRSSQFWRSKITDNGYFLLWPKEFYQDYFHDELTDGVPEVVETFRSVVKYMEAEFKDNGIDQ